MGQESKIDVGEYDLRFQSFGAGAPTVVFESGLDCGAMSFVNLAHHVSQFTRAVIYDRAGVGQSAAAPRPRTSRDVVHDLHMLLTRARLHGPYLLVGHSIAGLHLRLFAHHYPEQVAGVVLLDAAHPDQWTRMLKLLPSVAPNEPAALTTFRTTIIEEWSNPLHNHEGVDIAASAHQVREAKQFGQLPLVVITAGKDEWDDGFPTDVAAVIEQDWQALQRDLVTLSARSTHIIATESTHVIQECQPDLVLDIIREVVEDLRS
jgi:pimeloyl-ACP methyl ester carboxylesterase